MRSLLLACIIFLPSLASAGEITQEEYQRRYEAAADAVEAAFPSAALEDSRFSVLLEYHVRKARHEGDPIIDSPEHLLTIAKALAAEMKAIGMPVDAPEPPTEETAPAPQYTAEQLAEQKEQQAAASGDLQAYLRQAEKGQAGADPKLQSRARGGDRVAQAELDYDAKIRAIKAKVAAGHITESEAIAQRGQAHALHAAKLQEIQSAVQHQELMEELRKRRR